MKVDTAFKKSLENVLELKKSMTKIAVVCKYCNISYFEGFEKHDCPHLKKLGLDGGFQYKTVLNRISTWNVNGIINE